MEFEHRKDSGRIMAAQSKKSDKSPDYWGEIAIDIKDMTKVQVQDGLYIFRLNGWKKKTKAGATYLSLGIDRWVPKTQAPRVKDEDVPF